MEDIMRLSERLIWNEGCQIVLIVTMGGRKLTDVADEPARDDLSPSHAASLSSHRADVLELPWSSCLLPATYPQSGLGTRAAHRLCCSISLVTQL